MRKQTAPQIRDNREASSRKQSGLIAQDGSAQQSAMSKSVLDNRSHRTRTFTNAIVPQMTGAVSFRRVLGSASQSSHSFAAQPFCVDYLLGP